MVHFDNFRVVVGRQDFRGLFHQVAEQIHADGKVAGPNRGGLLGYLHEFGFFLGTVPGGPADDGLALFGGGFENASRHCVIGKVDDGVGGCDSGLKVVSHIHFGHDLVTGLLSGFGHGMAHATLGSDDANLQ